jgi:hypothetical protein
MVVSLEESGPNLVTVTFSAPGLSGPEHVTDWFLNLNPALDPAKLAWSAPMMGGQFKPPSFGSGIDAFKAAAEGHYDLHFAFPPQNDPSLAFGAGESLTVADFAFFAIEQDTCTPFMAAAHVQSTGPDGEDSRWVAAIPEPAGVLLVLLAAGLGTVRRRGAGPA